MLQQHQHEARDASIKCSVTHLSRPPGVALCLGPDDTTSIRLGLDLLSSGSPGACLGADLHMYCGVVTPKRRPPSDLEMSAFSLLWQATCTCCIFGSVHCP